MNNAAEVKAKLLLNLEAYCFSLFPAGQVINGEFRIGDITGRKSRHGKGGSLTVSLRGTTAGLWHDFADPATKGDVFDLWIQHHNTTFRDAFPEICKYAGVSNIERPKPRAKPARPDMTGLGSMQGTPVLTYLTETRGLTVDTLKAYRIRSHTRPSQHNTDFVAFQFACPDGEPVMLKSTGIKATDQGKKDTWTTAPYYTLWGWWMVKPSDRTIIITEGEYDAMSVHQLNPGVPVLSLPAGSSNLTFIENDFDALQRFEKILICTDADEAGEKCAAEMAKRLGQARCFRIRPPSPYKDANECLTKCNDESLDVLQWISAATSYDPPTLRSCKSFRRELADALRNRQTKGNVNDFLFPSIPFAFRDGETTIVSGLPGHGKSDFLYQSHLNEMKTGRKVCIASFEIPPRRMLEIIIWQLIGHEIASEEDMDKGLEWLDERLFWFCPKGATKWKELLADFDYAAARWSVSRFVIDSLHFLVEKEDYQGQDEFMRAVAEFSTLKGIHTAVVCHSLGKKGTKEIPSMGDVEGSGGITKPVDNGITIWRNAAKGEALEENPDDVATQNLHDGMIIVWKQRLTGDWPRRKLWFSKKARVFSLGLNDTPPPTITSTATTTVIDASEPF
jgi:twinkle protein